MLIRVLVASVIFACVVCAAERGFSQQEAAEQNSQTAADVQEQKSSGLHRVGKGQVVLKEVPKVTPEQPMSFWMMHKLDFSKQILESLTFGDFEDLGAQAEQMRVLSRIEGFVRRNNPHYSRQLQKFEVALKDLKNAAGERDAEQATKAFSQMTSSCVGCHTLLRNNNR